MGFWTGWWANELTQPNNQYNRAGYEPPILYDLKKINEWQARKMIDSYYKGLLRKIIYDHIGYEEEMRIKGQMYILDELKNGKMPHIYKEKGLAKDELFENIQSGKMKLGFEELGAYDASKISPD